VNDFLSLINDLPKMYEENYKLVGMVDDEICDISHEIELGNPKDVQGMIRLYKRQREILKKKKDGKG